MMRSIDMGIMMNSYEALEFNTKLRRRAKRNASTRDDDGRRALKVVLKRSGQTKLLDRDYLEAWHASGDARPRYFQVSLINTMCDGPETAMEYLVENGWARV